MRRNEIDEIEKRRPRKVWRRAAAHEAQVFSFALHFFALHDEMTQMQAAASPRRQTSGLSESGVRALSAEPLNRLSGRPFFLELSKRKSNARSMKMKRLRAHSLPGFCAGQASDAACSRSAHAASLLFVWRRRLGCQKTGANQRAMKRRLRSFF
ncbi:hypothetical protein [Ottowia massiliensis]|uniref:hypothetical protein n=1 Tax=Ottowia massiliensis TaxID=2045302 RepID=UPI001E3F6265|nr:hypothetical protein [Ottowia massiliensis]